jgi:TIR domain-containing protein
MSKPRDQVFISYARHDRLWKDRLLTHLTPLIREDGLCVWDDSLIKPGSKWREEIKAALSRAKVAVLLVTPHYLASSFVTTRELPPLLKAAADGGVRILWIAISASAFESTRIGEYQALNNPAAPLDKYKRSPGRLNEILVDIAKKIRDAYQSPVASGRTGVALRATKQTARLVLDCGMAPRVMVNQVHELRLLVRGTQSAGLRESVDQDKIHAGAKIYDFSANDVRSVAFDVDFPLETGRLQSVELQIDLNAPDFRVEEQLPRANPGLCC